MYKRVCAAAAAAFALFGVTASATTLNEADFGEFGNSFSAPTDFTGYNTILGSASGQSDFEYFRFDSFLPGTTSLKFTLKNTASSANMLVRLSSTAFSMPEWDWTIQELDAGNMQGRELYANRWEPEESYSFVLPEQFNGPLFGFARFYNAGSTSSMSIESVGAAAGGAMAGSVSAVPLPAALPLMLGGLLAMGAMGAGARIRRKTV